MTNEPMPDPATRKPADGETGVEHNKATSRRWIDVFNERDNAGEADVRGPGYVAHAPASLEPAALDSEAWTQFLAGFVKGFPDLRLTVDFDRERIASPEVGGGQAVAGEGGVGRSVGAEADELRH